MDIYKQSDVIGVIKRGLKHDGWSVKENVKTPIGYVDLTAEKDSISFVIEARGEEKGGFTTAEMNFQTGLGRLMARMTDKHSRYALAIPSTPDFIQVLQKYEGSFAFKALDIYLFVASGDHGYFVVPPGDIPAFIQGNRI